MTQLKFVVASKPSLTKSSSHSPFVVLVLPDNIPPTVSTNTPVLRDRHNDSCSYTFCSPPPPPPVATPNPPSRRPTVAERISMIEFAQMHHTGRMIPQGGVALPGLAVMGALPWQQLDKPATEISSTTFSSASSVSSSSTTATAATARIANITTITNTITNADTNANTTADTNANAKTKSSRWWNRRAQIGSSKSLQLFSVETPLAIRLLDESQW